MKIFKTILPLWILSIALLSAGFGSFGGLKRSFLSPQEAFKVDANISGNSIKSTIRLGNKIHIYAKDLHFRVIKPKEFELKFKKPEPREYDGDKVYYGTLNIDIPLSQIVNKGIKDSFVLEVDMSGCSDAGICYQPQKFKFNLKIPANFKSSNISTKLSDTSTQSEGFFSKISRLSSEGNSGKIAKALADEGVVFILILFFVAGLLLALTPCILPMIPILSSIIVKQAGKDGNVSRSTSFLISLVYVVSMSATYALIGVIAGLLGFDLQAHMNNPWIIIPIAAIFVALAFSLFGYFELALPASLQSKLTKASDNAQGKGLLGTAIMGALSALIVGTCTAPVISGAIIFISQTGDAVLGGISLFVMGIGAGVPLLLVGAGANKLVPKPGGWMTRVSQIFGVIMLAMALYVMRGILSPVWFMTLSSLLLMGSAIYMGVFDNSSTKKGLSKLIQLFAWVLLLYGSLIFIGAISGANSIFDPLAPFKGGTTLNQNSKISNSILIPLENRKGYSIERLQKEIAQANRERKGVVVDIGKENCAACGELEHITFTNPKVQDEIKKRFKFIQIDITNDTPKEQEILKHYGLFGAPNILFFDKNGTALKDKFQVGFIKPEKLLKELKSIK